MTSNLNGQTIVLSEAGADNTIAKSNNIFTIKDKRLQVPVVTLSARDSQNYQNF